MNKYWKLKCCGLALAAGWLGLGFLPSHVSAGFTTCDTDPIVHLSNGKTITLWAHIGADISTVNVVNFTLHVPRGVYATSVQYDQYGSVETLQVAADQRDDYYATDTTFIGLPGTSFTAWAKQSNGNATYSVNGFAGQTISISWHM